MKNILITGGAGFIGSHTCVELLENNGAKDVFDEDLVQMEEEIEDLKSKL